MRSLNDINLKDTLPDGLQSDTNIAELSNLISTQLQDLFTQSQVVLLMSKIDELPENVIDALAVQFHLEIYDVSYDLEIKRKLVKNAIVWHKYKGTVYSVQLAVDMVIQGGKVQEYWEYDGEIFHFRVGGITGALVDSKTTTTAVSLINKSKNIRSWLDGIVFDRAVECKTVISAAISVHRTIDVGLKEFAMPDIEAAVPVKGVLNIYREVNING